MNNRKRLQSASGQTSTEYMLLISVLVIAVVAGAYAFIPGFRSGTGALASDASSILDGGSIGGLGFDRGGNGDFGNGGTEGRGVDGMANAAAPNSGVRSGDGLGVPSESGVPAESGGRANAAGPSTEKNPTF